RQRSSLSLGLEEHVANEIAFKGELDIWQCSGLLDDRSQVLYLHWKHNMVMLLDESSQGWIRQWPIVEVCSQGQNNDDRAARFCRSSDQDINEALPFLFGNGRGEHFLKLVDHEHHPGPRPFYQLGGK